MDSKVVKKLPLFHPLWRTFKLASGFVCHQKRMFAVIVCRQWSDQILIRHPASLISVYHRLVPPPRIRGNYPTMRARIRSPGVCEMKIWGSLSGNACMSTHVQHGRGALQRPLAYLNTPPRPRVQAPTMQQKKNKKKKAITGGTAFFRRHCFPYRSEQHIYFSCALSSHFMVEKTVRWVKNTAVYSAVLQLE